MENDYWKDEILGSLKGIQRAEPNPFLFTRIEAKISAEKPASASPILRWAALALVVLLSVNTYALLSMRKNTISENSNSYNLSGFESY